MWRASISAIRWAEATNSNRSCHPQEPSYLVARKGDEATSALDNASEKVVQKALDQVMVGRTSVVVAHRLSTIQKCDKIAVLEGGEIVEDGTHASLMSKGHSGTYFGLVSLQQGMATDVEIST